MRQHHGWTARVAASGERPDGDHAGDGALLDRAERRRDFVPQHRDLKRRLGNERGRSGFLEVCPVDVSSPCSP